MSFSLLLANLRLVRKYSMEPMSTPARLDMTAVMALTLRFCFVTLSRETAAFSHSPVSHPTAGKINDMNNLGELSLLSAPANIEDTWYPKIASAQTAPTMVPMARPLRGAWRYCCSCVFLWVVIVVSLWWCGGRRRLRCRRGRCRFGLGWLCGAVVLCIGYAVAVSGDLDREGKGVSGAGVIGDAQMCLVCSDSGEGASDLRRGGIDFVVSVTV